MSTTFSEDSLCAVNSFLNSLRLHSFPSTNSASISGSSNTKTNKRNTQNINKIDPVGIVIDAVVMWHEQRQQANNSILSD